VKHIQLSVLHWQRVPMQAQVMAFGNCEKDLSAVMNLLDIAAVGRPSV